MFPRKHRKRRGGEDTVSFKQRVSEAEGDAGAFIWNSLTDACPHAAAGVAGIHRTRSSSSLELHLIFKRTPPLLFHLPSGATRRKSFFGRSVRLTTESGQWQSCGREIIYYNICVHAVYSCPNNGTIRVRRDAKLGWGMSGTVCSLTFAFMNPLFSWGGGGVNSFQRTESFSSAYIFRQ